MRRLLPMLLAALSVAACRASAPRPAAPAAPAAAEALARAQAALRAGGPQAPARARAELEQALAAEPGWVAPRRLLDEILRVDLLALESLAAYRARLATGDGGAEDLYLAGRLEGRAGSARYERAAALDPTLAWAHHGVAFAASSAGRSAEACRAAERALALARDPWERTFFVSTLARFERDRGDWARALELLDARAADPDTAAGDRTALQVQATLVMLTMPRDAQRGAAIERGLALLATGDLTEVEVAQLAAALRARAPGGDAGRVALALAAQPGAARDRLRAEILLDEGPSPLAFGLLERAFASDAHRADPGALLRAARFATGDYRGAVERWLADLPPLVLAGDGLPADARLRSVVAGARALPQPADAATADLVSFGEALLAAGWLHETRAVAAALAVRDLDTAAALDARALAALQWIAGLRRTLRETDRDARRRAASGPAAGLDLAVLAPSGPAAPGPGGPARSLDDLLAALAPHEAQMRALVGAAAERAPILDALRASPRLTYGGMAEVIHPGPAFSAADEQAGLGRAGAPVGGLAATLRSLHRFGIFGQLAGDPPDATLLPILRIEQRAGEHLGTRFQGTVVWCAGADVPSRAGRRGARIAGAALHEGYWIDVDEVRGELAAWSALRAGFADSRERVERALAVTGLAVAPGELGARDRIATGALLDQAARVRLAVLRERAAPGEVLGRVAFDDVLEASAVHEEGHLCDRARFLPIARNLGAAFLLLLDAGFSPQRVHEELEYRAQLVALACAREPRIVLAQILDAAESGGGLTAHAGAYTRLLEDLVRTLDREMGRGAFAHLSGERTLVHQLHRLGGDEVRALGVTLAARKRLTRAATGR